MWPGNEHGDEATGKWFDIKIFGSKGVLSFSGDDKRPSSGNLTAKFHDAATPDFISEGFLMENTEAGGYGPESLLQFIAACRGLPFENGADAGVGLEAVRVLNAMYRSAASKQTEKAL